MKREEALKQLRKSGCRITKQREILIDIILKKDCTSCKEIYYRAIKKDSGIGMATVYRMVHALEEIGAIKMESSNLIHDEEYIEAREYILEMEDDHVIALDDEEMKQLIEAGLKIASGSDENHVKQLLVRKSMK